MSILIKGMEMPKENTMLWLYPDGNVRVWRQDIDHDEWKTAIELPKCHRRLIEEPNSFDYSGLAYIACDDYFGIAKYFAAQVRNQPTIIPSDRDGE